MVEVERGLIAGEPVLLERALGLGLLRRDDGDIRLGGGKAGRGRRGGGFGLQHRRAGRIDRLIGRDRLLGERVGPFEFRPGIVGGGLGRSELRLGLGHLRLAGVDLLADPRHRRFGAGNLRLRLVQRDLVVGIVEHDQRIAGLDMGVLGNRDRLDVAGDLRRDGRRIGADIGIVGRDDEAAVGPPVVAVEGARHRLPRLRAPGRPAGSARRASSRAWPEGRWPAPRLAIALASSAGTASRKSRDGSIRSVGRAGPISMSAPRLTEPIPSSFPMILMAFSCSSKL